MKKAAQGIFCLLLVLSLLLSPAGAAAQTPPPPERPVPVPAGQPGTLQPWPLTNWPGGSGPLPHALAAFSDPLVSVIVQFEGQPLGERVAERGPLAARDQRNYVSALRSRQADVLSRVQQAGGALIGQFTKAYNGVQVQVPASELAALRAMSGVKAVHPVRTYYPALDHSTEIIRAGEVWALDGGGYTGEGVTIAVIDTGIDYTHAAFGGPGTADAYTNNNKNILEPGTFPTAKVVGGWDFAGTAYTGSNTAVADPDPLDEHGHGTHVASTAAGFSAGAVAQGVAPDAKLYALKVFGASGSTQLVYLALDWCMDPNNDGNIEDRVDVVNLSLGGPFGTGDPADPEVAMIEQLAALGTVVVAASGNDGSVEYVTGSPASADSAISVASTISDGVREDEIASSSSRGPRGYDSALKPEISAPGEYIFAAARSTGNQGVYMNGTSMATPHVAGVAALVRQAHPEWTAEQVKAALMNTAVNIGAEVPRMGAGRVDALRAVTTDTVAVGDPKLVSLSWGVIEFNLPLFSGTKTVTISNSALEPKTYQLSWSWGAGSNSAGADLFVPESITIPADGQSNFTVTLELNAEQIQQSVMGWEYLEEYYGFVRLENQLNSNDVLVLPFYFLPAPYNEITATNLFVNHATAIGSFDHYGAVPSEIEVWPVYATDPNETWVRDDADLRLVMMDYVHTDYFGDYIFFGFNLHGSLHNPQPYFAEIDLYLDTNLDGADDYVIFNWADGQNFGWGENNDWVPVIINLNEDWYQFLEADFFWGDFNTGTMFWCLPAMLFDFGPDDSRFDFWVKSFDVNTDYDIIPSHRVDYRQTPFSSSLETYTPQGDHDVDIRLWANSVSGYLYNQPEGAALFDYSGKAGPGQATFLPFEFDFYKTFAPLITR